MVELVGLFLCVVTLMMRCGQAVCFGVFAMVVLGLGACNRGWHGDVRSSHAVMHLDGVEWQQLNPARGDQSPQAANLWGDRTGPGPAGFLLKPVDGFRSPPHIHNTAYRGVVISGLIHNDDPAAADMFMPSGSFWTQPAGEIHITAAKGSDTLAYIEVEEQFGVHPAEEAFDDGERPLNIDVTNLVWANPPGDLDPQLGVRVAYLWGNQFDNSPSGMMLVLPIGLERAIQIQHDSLVQIVMIQGGADIEGEEIEAGSYYQRHFSGGFSITHDTSDGSMMYIRTKGHIEFTQ
jgi:hypothetical protein